MESTYIFINAQVYTMEKENSKAEAFAIHGGKFLCVGTNGEIRSIPHDHCIDLGGHTVLPGLIDSHLHISASARQFSAVDLRGAKSIEDVLDRLRKKVQITSPGQWIRGLNFDHELFDPPLLPNRHDLDSISADHPIFISRYCQHAHVANTLALQLAGMYHPYSTSSDTLPLEENGYPNGILLDLAAEKVVSLIPQSYNEEANLRAVCRDMAQHGLTGGHTVRGIHVNLDESIDIYQNLLEEHALPLRVYVSFDELPSLPMRTGFGNENIRYGFYKIYLDGSLGTRGAALREDYSDAPGKKGLLNYSQEKLNAMVLSAHERGIQVGIHCVGDAAIDASITAFEVAWHKVPRKGTRFRLIHASVMTPELIERCRTLPIVFDCQPQFVSSDVRWAGNRLGTDRAKYTFAYRKLLDAGFIVAGGSDSPVESYDPFAGIWSAVNRCAPDGHPANVWYPENCCTVYQALCMYTKNAAFASFEENTKGTITPGKLADFVVVDRDPFGIDPSGLRDIKVLSTYLGGICTYDSGNLPTLGDPL